MKHSKHMLFGAIALALLVGCAYFFSQRAIHKPAEPLETITLGAEGGLLTSAIWIAERQGYFRDERIEVIIKPFRSGRLALLAMLQGKPLDIVTVANTPIMLSSFERQDFRILASFAESQSDDNVIGRKDRNIASIADLKGKKIGVPKETSAEFFLELILVENGISPSEVTVVNINPNDLPQALADNQVDAISVWQPYVYRAIELLQENAIQLTEPGTHRATFNFVAMQDFVQNHQGAIRKFIRAVDKANSSMSRNKEDSQAILAARLNIKKEAIEKLLVNFNYRLFLDQLLLLDLESQARWAMKRKITDKPIPANYLHFISSDALMAVKPQAVNLIEQQDPKPKTK